VVLVHGAMVGSMTWEQSSSRAHLIAWTLIHAEARFKTNDRLRLPHKERDKEAANLPKTCF
jgi:hypothetical protein